MPFSQRLALSGLVVVGVTLAAHVAVTPHEESVHAIRGYQAPYRPWRPPETAAVFDASRLVAGPVVAITEDSGAVFILQTRAWLKYEHGKTFGPFGADTRGAPGSITSGTAIEVRDSSIYIVDRVQRAVLIFRRTGQWVRSVDLAMPSATIDRFVIDRTGRWIISAITNTTPGRPSKWLLLRYGGGTTPDTIYSRAGDAFDFAIPVIGDNGRVFVFNSTTYEIEELGDSGVIRLFGRPNPPRVPIPDAAHRRLDHYLADSPIRESVLHYVPVVAQAAALSGGQFAVAMSASLDDVIVEEIDSLGHAVATRAGPVSLPIAIMKGSLLTLREDANQTIIERRRF